MVAIKSELKTYSHETSVNKFNISNSDLSAIENDIEYLLFVEHEEDMKNYSHLKPIVSELAKIMVRHADAAVATYQRNITIDIAESLKDHVQEIVLGKRISTTEKRRVDVTIDDEKIVSTQIVGVGAPLPDFKDKNYDW